MPLARRRQYQFNPPSTHQPVEIFDFSQGLNTRDPDNQATVTKGNNARFSRLSGFSQRPGTLQKGQQIGTAGKILGLHSYVKKDTTATLLSTYNTDIYKFTETGSANTIATSSNAQATGYSKD